MDDVIARTWKILSRHFLTFAFLVGIAQLLPLVLKLYLPGKLAEVNMQRASVSTALTVAAAAMGIALVTFVLSTAAQAIVIYAAFQDLRGQAVDAGESLLQGFKRVLPVIFTS